MWFEMLVGETPFRGETSLKVILRHVHEAPRRPSAAQPNNSIPRFVDDLILRLLAESLEERPTSARELLDQLDAFARPCGWHVSANRDVGRRSSHNDDVSALSAAAAELGDQIEFTIEHDDFGSRHWPSERWAGRSCDTRGARAEEVFLEYSSERPFADVGSLVGGRPPEA